jgi:hypothetical protein
VFIQASTRPFIRNQLTDSIDFQTTVSGSLKTPFKLSGLNAIPGEDNISTLGTSSFKWANVYATTFTGTATQSDTLKVGASYRSADIAQNVNTIAARDGSGNIFANIFQGQATSAQFADLAEKYLADAEYEVGTVVAVGGEKEVTASKYGDRAIGAVSANPAFMMNKDLDGGTYIALKGRVPVKVIGAVRKGQQLVASNDGTAVAAVPHANDVFAIALESSDDTGVKLVEALIL